MTPKGVLIPPFYNHQPAGIIGNREYLEAVKKAIEEALDDGGIGRADVFMPDGEGHYLMVKLENNTDSIPVCYGDFWGTKEIDGETYIVPGHSFSSDDWGKAHRIVSELESFYEVWKRLYKNFSFFVLYLFLEKKRHIDLYHQFQKLVSEMFWDKEKAKLPDIKEVRNFFDKLWKEVKFPDFCMRTVLYGWEEDVKACVDLSLTLLEKGFKNHSLEGIGLDKNGYFRFLIKEKIPERLESGWRVEGRHLLVPYAREKNE